MMLLRELPWFCSKNSLASLVIAAFLAAPAMAQQVESPAPPPDTPKAKPFLPSGTVGFLTLLPPPPGPDSLRDKDDVTETQFLQTVSPERLATAEQDDAFVYARFSTA
jgi:hypothetical protein